MFLKCLSRGEQTQITNPLIYLIIITTDGFWQVAYGKSIVVPGLHHLIDYDVGTYFTNLPLLENFPFQPALQS